MCAGDNAPREWRDQASAAHAAYPANSGCGAHVGTGCDSAVSRRCAGNGATVGESAPSYPAKSVLRDSASNASVSRVSRATLPRTTSTASGPAEKRSGGAA